MKEGARSRLLAPLALVSAATLFRLPALSNASTVDSDSAVVGLQAMHILHGEWSRFLWGSSYQTSVDSFVAAPYLGVFGPSSFALMLSTYVGHLLAILFAYATLRRHLPTWTAALVAGPLVFTPSPVETYILGPPRQAAITLVFASIWAIDGASRTRWASMVLLGGAMLGGMACFADPYALLFLPALVLFVLLACFDPPREEWEPRYVGIRLFGAIVGLAAGLVPLVLLLVHPHSAHGEMTFTTRVLAHNYDLLVDPCLPWVLSTKVFFNSPPVGYVQFHPRSLFRVLQLTGAAVLVAGILFGGVATLLRSLPWRLRRLAMLGFVMLPMTLGSFLFSLMVMDFFSARYLVAIVLVAPFALAAAGHLLSAPRFAVVIAPYLVSVAAAGWIGFGELTRGARIVKLPRGGAADELALGALLAERGIASGVADYWVSYRVTFLLRERAKIVPLHANEDRYAPYRTAFDAAVDRVYVFDPRRSREDLKRMDAELRGGNSPLGSVTDVVDVGHLKVYFLRRGPSS